MKEARETYTAKGILVRSVSEAKIADALTSYGIEYVYEKPTTIGNYTFSPDFYLPDFNVYIEYFGMIKNKEYTKKTRWKRKMYRKQRVKLISLYPKHVWNKSDKQIIIFITRGIKALNHLK